MVSPIWLQIGAEDWMDLSKGDGCLQASRRRLKEQLSGLSPSSFLLIPLRACRSSRERGKMSPLTLHKELWLSYKILWLQFLSQMWVTPVMRQRNMFPKICSLRHLWSHLWEGKASSWLSKEDKKMTFMGAASDFLIISMGICRSQGVGISSVNSKNRRIGQ